jgi:hypothetical protein
MSMEEKTGVAEGKIQTIKICTLVQVEFCYE